MAEQNENLNDQEGVHEQPPEPDVAPKEIACPVCERLIPSPAPETCPHCQAPIQTILALLETADSSLTEAMRDLKSGNLKSARKRLEFVNTTSKAHRLRVGLIQAIIDRLSGHPEIALGRIKAISEQIEDAHPEPDFLTLLENTRSQCVADQDALAACCEHYNYGLFEARRGHFEAAKKSLIKALNEVPWHAESHALMGKVLLALRQEDDARYHLKRALASDPTNSTATRLLNELSGAEKISVRKIYGAVGHWIQKSPAWAGSILVLLILIAITLTALLKY